MTRTSFLPFFLILLFYLSCKTDQKPVVDETNILVEHSTVERQEGDCDNEDINSPCAEITLTYPVIKEGPVALRQEVAAWSGDFLTGLLDPGLEQDSENSLASAMEGFLTMHREMVLEGSGFAMHYTLEVRDTLLFRDAEHLTLRMDAYTFTGGAHPNSTTNLATFDLKTGKRLRPVDLVKDLEKLHAAAEKKFRETRKEAFEEGFDFSESWPFVLTENVGLTTEGLFFCYVPYEVTPYAMGFTEFVIPYNQLEKL